MDRIDSITIPRWFDRHLHLREGELLKLVLPSTLGQQLAGAILMGNFETNPVTTIKRAVDYHMEIRSLLPQEADFQARVALYLTDETDPNEVVWGFQQNIWHAVKLMLRGPGGSTNSHFGVEDTFHCYPVFEVMQRHQIPLLNHGEVVDGETDEFDREVEYLKQVAMPLLRDFPDLPFVFEHVSDSRVADFVATCNDYQLGATITPYHLIKNRNAMFLGGMNPEYYCRPVLKREDHRLQIRKYVTSGHPRFGAGTDSAPHLMEKKMRISGCSGGIFNAPAAVELYTTVFDEENALQHLENFLSVNLLHMYGLKPSTKTMTLVRQPTEIPEMVGNVKVFMGGEIIPWRLA